MISGERSAKYVFTVGMKHALQVGGVDPNEHFKPCSPDHHGQNDCVRCAWCDANEGFVPDTVFSWQCHTETNVNTAEVLCGTEAREAARSIRGRHGRVCRRVRGAAQDLKGRFGRGGSSEG